VGTATALDGQVSLNKAIVQLTGNGEVLDAGRFREVAEQSSALRTTLLRHEQVVFAQAQQSAAFNAAHMVEARLSRWLLRSRDLSGGDTLLLTQEFLAQMLGVQRSSVSPAALALQQAGLIRYSRGRIEILDVEGLQKASCECYGTVKAQYDRLLKSHFLKQIRLCLELDAVSGSCRLEGRSRRSCSLSGRVSGGVMRQRPDDFSDNRHDGAIRTKLGEALRQQYDLMEPLPQALVELLERLGTRARARDTARAEAVRGA
jgi:hypothetical protein